MSMTNEYTRRTSWIMTQSGICFNPLCPRVEDIAINDIAHALALINRFSGHTKVPYSVAQHCVLVSLALEIEWPDLALKGLLHDGAEAYACDLPRPLKRQEIFAPYRAAMEHLQSVIYQAFGLTDDEPGALHLIDRRMLRTEQRDLMPPPLVGHPIYADECRDDVAPFAERIVALPWFEAKRLFLERFAELTTT